MSEEQAMTDTAKVLAEIEKAKDGLRPYLVVLEKMYGSEEVILACLTLGCSMAIRDDQEAWLERQLKILLKKVRAGRARKGGRSRR